MERELVCSMSGRDAIGRNERYFKSRKMEYKGKTYYFCSDSCERQFGQY